MEEREIDLLAALQYLLKRIYLPIICGIVLALAAFGATKVLMKPTYQAITRVYILNQSHEDYIAYSDIQSSSQLAADCEVLITGKNVTREVNSRLNLSAGDGLGAALGVSLVDNTRILQISVIDTDPQRAADIANCVREVASEQIVQIMGVDSVNLIYPAAVPTRPHGPNTKRNVAYGAVAGILLACALIFIRFLLDEKIKSEEDVTKFLGLNTIGVIPATDSLSVKKRRR